MINEKIEDTWKNLKTYPAPNQELRKKTGEFFKEFRLAYGKNFEVSELHEVEFHREVVAFMVALSNYYWETEAIRNGTNEDRS